MCCGSSSVDAAPDPSFNMADKIANNVIKTAPDGPVRKDRNTIRMMLSTYHGPLYLHSGRDLQESVVREPVRHRLL